MSHFRNKESFVFPQGIHICVFSFLAWHKERNIEKNSRDFNPKERAPILCQFYVKARSVNGKRYLQNSMKAKGSSSQTVFCDRRYSI